MKNKTELSEELNQILGVDIRWQKLTHDELVEILKAVSQPTVLHLLKVKRHELRKRVEGRGFGVLKRLRSRIEP